MLSRSPLCLTLNVIILNLSTTVKCVAIYIALNVYVFVLMLATSTDMIFVQNLTLPDVSKQKNYTVKVQHCSLTI